MRLSSLAVHTGVQTNGGNRRTVAVLKIFISSTDCQIVKDSIRNFKLIKKKFKFDYKLFHILNSKFLINIKF